MIFKAHFPQITVFKKDILKDTVFKHNPKIRYSFDFCILKVAVVKKYDVPSTLYHLINR